MQKPGETRTIEEPRLHLPLQLLVLEEGGQVTLVGQAGGLHAIHLHTVVEVT
jgi:hypothetical protein